MPPNGLWPGIFGSDDVDEIAVAGPTVVGEFDTAPLSDTEIAAFAQHMALQLATVDPQCVVGLVADSVDRLAGATAGQLGRLRFGLTRKPGV